MVCISNTVKKRNHVLNIRINKRHILSININITGKTHTIKLTTYFKYFIIKLDFYIKGLKIVIC